MKFNHLTLIKVESLTFWWSHRSVIWCESSREESEAGAVCTQQPLSCGGQSLSFSVSSDCFLLLPVILPFFPGETENEAVRCENWSRRDIPVPIGLGDSDQASTATRWRRQQRGDGGGRRSMVDRYPRDNLTSAFNSTCPHLCFVS